MKILVRAVTALILLITAGCATRPLVVTYQEACANQGMVFVGTQNSHGTATGTVEGPSRTVRANGRNYYQLPEQYSITENYSSTAYSCAVSKSEIDLCEVKNLQKSVAPKMEYNNDISGKRAILVMGYMFFLVPGFVLDYLVWGPQGDKVMEESRKIASEMNGACGHSVGASKEHVP